MKSLIKDRSNKITQLSKLKVGDVFEVKKGFNCYAKIAAEFIYSNITEKSKTANDMHKTEVKVGEVFKTTKNSYDTKCLLGRYVVTNTAFTGGGTGMGDHDVYPDGHYVVARKLNPDGTYNGAGKIISFYQSGCFTAMEENVPVIRKMTLKFI